MSHITTAAKSGMKAGLRAYEASLERSGLPQVQEIAEEFFSLRAKDRFAWYCDRFGEKVAAAKRTPTRSATRTQAPRTQPQREESEVEKLRRKLAEAEAREKAQAEERKVERTLPTGKQIGFVERIANRRGDKLEVSVKLNGKTLTFAGASAYIEAAIADGTVRVKNGR